MAETERAESGAPVEAVAPAGGSLTPPALPLPPMSSGWRLRRALFALRSESDIDVSRSNKHEGNGRPDLWLPDASNGQGGKKRRKEKVLE